MKIGFVTPSVSRRAGGIFEIQRRVAQELQSMPDTSVEVFGLGDDFAETDRASWSPVEPHVFEHVGPTAFRHSPQLRDAVLNSNCDLLHLHVLWMGTSLVTRKWQTRRNMPCIVTINGMLEPWAIKHSRWRKRIAWWLFEKGNTGRADCICVNSESEYESVRSFGLSNPIAIIPNGVDLLETDGGKSVVTDRDGMLRDRMHLGNRKTILFLGRIHPKKGLKNLLIAWGSHLRQSSSPGAHPINANARWRLVIAGWDELGHETELKELATESGLKWVDLRDQPSHDEIACSDLQFIGPQFGSAKDTCLRLCSAFVLPSYSEGFPMAILEAWSYAKPVLMTAECNLPVGFECGAAIPIMAAPESIATGLRWLVEASDLELQEMGCRGQKLTETQFTWPIVTRHIHDVSKWVVDGGSPPPCVRM